MNAEDRRFVERAARYLERPSFVVRVAGMLGAPVEKLLGALPGDAEKIARRAVEASLEKALAVAVTTLGEGTTPDGSVARIDAAGSGTRLKHKVVVGATGAAGGFFGLAGLAVELPLTTTLMLRSIAAVARDFGEDLDTVESRMECLTVFCLGGPSRGDDAAETAYYGVRSSMAVLVHRAAEFAAGKTAQEIADALARGSAPAIARLVAAIASRFNVVVTEKLLAQAVPAVGAASGALVNVAFADHFNNVARYHFGLRRLERLLGEEAVRGAYRKVSGTLDAPGR